jgi:rhomboid protease GluP
MSVVPFDQNQGRQTDWFPLCSIASRRTAHELGLVVLSMRCAYQITQVHESWYLLEIQGRNYRQASVQIGLYCEDVRKNKRQKANAPVREKEASRLMFCLIALALCTVYGMQGSEIGESLLTRGRMDTHRVWQGEWWRAITPLFLHADIGHLIANLGFGLIFAWFVIRRWGNLVGWLFILLTGVLGNLLTAAAYSWITIPHLSIGASTAVMGSIGLLAGASAWEKRHEKNTGIGWLGPVGISLLGGCALFALLGTGGDRTDVVAHLWGWVSGLLLGYGFAHRQLR